MPARIIRTDGRFEYTAGANLTPGQVVLRPDGSPAVLDGLDTVPSGALVSPMPLKRSVIMELDANSADTFSAGADVYVVIATGLATATASGNTLVGKAIRAKTNGQTVVLVNCG